MFLDLEQKLRAAVAAHLQRAYNLELDFIVVEVPPRPALGDFALPLSFELAKRLRRPPRVIAQELAASLTLPQGFTRAEAAGGGYLNVFVDRQAAWTGWAQGASGLRPRLEGKVIVEHTNINPNKAAHIGHLRNAVLGDTWVRLLRARGETVEVQNLQDNTGVQVADVVAAFLFMPPGDGTPESAQRRVEAAIADPRLRFDYLCWDLYAAISQHYERAPEDLAQWRPQTLHAIEAGHNPIARLGETISSEIARRHLQTMARIGVEYDVLPRESEILQLHLWEHAFALLKARAAVRLETEGKNAGCWVMDRTSKGLEGEEESKVLVRSNHTVTYVAKDIAYQLWKFGVLPVEFGYRQFYRYPEGKSAWTSSLTRDAAAPDFGGGDWVFNVIDARQSYLQEIVVAGLRALGFERQAGRSVHFSYEMVALSAACAQELGYAGGGEGERVDVSGRKGTGVKADDLLDRLQTRTLEEVALRHPEMAPADQVAAAHAIAVGALRYFLLKYTRTTVIAFDFKEALSFDGESGPYVQYAAVRAANILRKAGAEAAAAAPTPGAYLQEDSAWVLLSLALRLGPAVEQGLSAQEPAILAKYAFQLAQTFNNFYHHTPVLQEADQEKRRFLLGLVATVRKQLEAALDLMGIAVPEAM